MAQVAKTNTKLISISWRSSRWSGQFEEYDLVPGPSVDTDVNHFVAGPPREWSALLCLIEGHDAQFASDKERAGSGRKIFAIGIGRQVQKLFPSD